MTINKDGLWIDQDGWEEHLDSLNLKSSLKDNIHQFVHEGYTIIPRAIDEKVIDEYREEVQRLITQKQKLKLSFVDGVYEITDNRIDANRPLTKILDTYVHIEAARNIIFSETLLDFICAVFREPPLAFQGLHFEVGSTQALHQDTAYVVVDQPDHFLASWVALEDIQPGSGELIYIPKSHKFQKYYFDPETRRRHWNAAADGNEHNVRFIEWLYEEAERLGLSVKKFAPRKGDILIWHSNLAHGGGEINKPNSTRRSLVTHYCPINNTPYYFESWSTSESEKIPIHPRAQISSYYYKIPNPPIQDVVAPHTQVPASKIKHFLTRGKDTVKQVLKQANLWS